MKRFTALLVGLLFAGFVFTGCGDDDTVDPGTLALNLKMTYEGAPLVIGERYQFDGSDILFERVSFFMSDLRLTKATASDVIKDVDYLNLTDSHNTPEKANAGFDYVVSNVKAGNYDGLSYDLGVSESVNATTPADYDASSALSNDAEHWADWSSYIFIKIQGRMDTNGDGDLNQNIVMHLGSDDAFRTVNLSKDFEIMSNATTTLDLDLDIYNVFDDGTTKYDFIAVPITHSLSFLDQINFVATGVQRASILD